MQNTVEKSYKFNKFRLSDIWASIKRPTAPSHICHLALQLYILVIFNSTLWPSQDQDRKGCTQQLLWLCSGSDQSRTLILVWDVSFNPIYLCYSKPVWSNENAKLSAMQSTRSQVDNKLGENVFFCLLFSWLFFCTWVWKSTFENEEGDLVPVKKYMHIISCFFSYYVLRTITVLLIMNINTLLVKMVIVIVVILHVGIRADILKKKNY